MHLFSIVLAAALFAAACNLDTVILSMSCAVRGVRLSAGQSLVLAGLTTLITWLSLVLGDAAALVLGGRLPGVLGGLALVGVGLWSVLDWLRRPDHTEQPEGLGGGSVALAAALAVNNAGVGVAAGVSGIPPLAAALANFAVTLAALPLGRRLGDKVAGRLLGEYALPLSGMLLVALGLWEALA